MSSPSNSATTSGGSRSLDLKSERLQRSVQSTRLILREIERTKLDRYRPYPKQKEFHAAGAQHRERLLKAANQVGKTTCGAAEAAFHLTGKYPDWWQGRRFDRPVRGWAGSDGFQATRDGAQRILVGPPRLQCEWGTGLIPGDDLLEWSRATGGVPDCLDGVVVQHRRRGAGGAWVDDGLSTLGFKSYDQGREKWQGETLDFVWFDEEPPDDVYVEGLTRTNATGGLVWLTFTPLKGMSEVVMQFKDCPGF